MSATLTDARTITGRHPVTGEPIPVTLADDETVVGWSPDETPLVIHASGKPGGTFGVVYLIDPMPYDDLEAFDPLGIGSF